MITSLSDLYFRLIRFILLLKTKKVISLSYRSGTSSWKQWRWVRLDLTFTMRDIYINSNPNLLATFTSSRSTEFKDILSWNISQMITTTTMKQRIPFGVWREVNGSCGNNMIRISQWRESHYRTNSSVIIEQILVSEERKKSKRAGLWESQSGIPVRKLTSWVR